EHLQVIWHSNKKAWIMTVLCQNYMVGYHSKHLKAYAEKQNISNKFLLICVHNFCSFPDVVTLHRDITSISQETGFQEVDEENVAEVLDSYSELSTEDLLLLEQQQRMEESTGEEENPAPMTLTLKVLSTAMDRVNTAMKPLAENDPNINRSSSVRAVVKGMLCYKELYLK
ncbi:hypothetical protein Hamer_G004283, partial [Homarus americanus]